MFHFSPPKKNTGFSTLEMLIAMAIILIALSGTLMLTSGNQSLSVDSQTGVEALGLAQKVLENEQALARKDFKLVVSTTTNEKIGTVVYQESVDAQTLSDFVTKKVKTTISWQGTYGRSPTVSLTTLVTNFENAVGADTCDSTVSGNWASPQVTNILFGNVSGINDSAGTYQITDLDAYQKRLYVTINQPSQSVGPSNPSTAIDSNTVGAITWSNPNNSKTSDDVRSTATLSGTAATHYLKVTNFGFAIPTGATILGVSVAIERSRTGGSSGEVRDKEVKLVKANGVLSTTDKALTGTNWPTSDTVATYGSSGDLWGEGWKPSDINSSNFGVVLSVVGSSGTTNRVANVDNIQITVTYIKNFYVLDISNPTTPVYLSSLATSSINTGLNSLAVATSSAGSFAYVATNAGPSTGQLEVIDVGTSSPYAIATYTVPTVTGTGIQALGSTVYYSNGYLYLGLTKTATGPEFNIIDVHNPFNIPTPVGGYSVGSGVESIFVKNGYAYLATDDNTKELIVLDVHNPNAPALVGSYNASGSNGFGYGKILSMVGDVLYLGRTYVSNGLEFYTLDASSTAPLAFGAVDVGPNSANPFSVNGIVVRDYLSFLLTGSASNGGNFLVFDTGNLKSPTQIATVPLPNSGAGTSLDCEASVLYAASVPASGGFQNRGSLSMIKAP